MLAWYDRHARDLPWRRTCSPYHVWVSEVMLQQTQVATVVAYFERFIAAFPTIADLAAAEEQEVLRLWEGLGYYRRARQLHLAAKEIVAHHRGEFPSDPENVRRLPGIGRYTAGAILSIAFDQREAILEANTFRVYSRLLAYRGDPRSTQGTRDLWAAAESWLPRKRVGAFNQALMELGSELCLPKAPRCDQCPVAAICGAYTQGLEAQIPPPMTKPKIEQRHEIALVLKRRGKVLLVQQPEGARWAGLWDFVRGPMPEANGTKKRKLPPKQLPTGCIAAIAEQVGCTPGTARHLATIRHSVTRFRITLDAYEAECTSKGASSVSGNGQNRATGKTRWFRLDEVHQLPLNVTGRKLMQLLHERND